MNESGPEAGRDGAPRAGTPRLVLASASAARQALLRHAGVDFTSRPAQIDEDEVKRALRAEGADAPAAAETLAELKAQRVSRLEPGALVVGADQMLVCGDVWFDKPPDLEQAAAQLRALAGKQHRLCSAVCVVRDGTRLWHLRDEARMTMRPFGEAFVRDYLAAVGTQALASVGCYQLEGRGVQLFSRVEGDFFTVLGLPLLPLLAFLREHGIVPR